MVPKRAVVAVAATISLLVAAGCSSSKKSSQNAGGSGGSSSASSSSSSAGAARWTVDTSSCADPKAATAKVSGDIKIGSVFPLSGSVAAAYAPLNTGMKAYFDYANANNVLPGHKIDFQVADDQYNPAKTPAAVNSLLDKGVVAFMGITGTPDNLAVRDLLNKNCIPQMQASTGGPALNDVTKYPWTSTQTAPFDIEGRIWATRIAQDFPSGKVATFLSNSSVGSDTGGGFTAEAATAGLSIVSKQTIEPTQTTAPTSQLNAIADSGAQAIFAVPLGAQCPPFLKELANVKAAHAGWNPKVYLTSTCAFESLLKPAGSAADGVITASSYLDTGNPDTVAGNQSLTYLNDQLKKTNAQAGLAIAAVGWAIAEIGTQALKDAAASPQGLSPAGILDAYRNMNFHSTVMRSGVNAKMSGTKDDVLIQSLQMVKYDATAGHFVDDGQLITKFESS